MVIVAGSAYTYERALLRLASLPYDAASREPRAHITNKWVQVIPLSSYTAIL